MAWNVKIERTKILGILQLNREQHKQIVIEAWAGYHKAVVKELERRLELIKKDSKVDSYVRLPQPEDHTDEYDTIIGMLQMSTEEFVTIGAIEYRSYVEDKWDWKDRWMTSTVSYTTDM